MFINTAGVKFNDNTDLIIKAQQDGTIISCFNRANGVEYVTGEPPQNVSVEITNTTNAGRTVFYASLINGIIESLNVNLSSGVTRELDVLKDAMIKAQNNYTWRVISGEAVVDGVFCQIISDHVKVEIILQEG